MKRKIGIRHDGPVKILGSTGVLAFAIKQSFEFIIAGCREYDTTACRVIGIAR